MQDFSEIFINIECIYFDERILFCSFNSCQCYSTNMRLYDSVGLRVELTISSDFEQSSYKEMLVRDGFVGGLNANGGREST